MRKLVLFLFILLMFGLAQSKIIRTGPMTEEEFEQYKQDHPEIDWDAAKYGRSSRPTIDTLSDGRIRAQYIAPYTEVGPREKQPAYRPVEPQEIESERAVQRSAIPKTAQEQELKQTIRDEIEQLQGEILTTYSPEGEPIHQSQDAKGWHRQFGAATLDNGRAVVNLNSSPAEGKQDVSFIADSTYRGVAWSLDSTNTNTYWIIPLSGTQVLVKSSDGTDTATVRFLLEGN